PPRTPKRGRSMTRGRKSRNRSVSFMNKRVKGPGQTKMGNAVKKYGRSTKSRKGKKKPKPLRELLKRMMEMPGAVGTLHCYLPTESNTDFDFKCYDIIREGTKASGFFSAGRNEANWLGYSILTKRQVTLISKAGEVESETTDAANSFNGIFDPAPVGVSTGTGGTHVTGVARNYVKARETFVFDKVDLNILISNAQTTPVRLWIDVWKCKKDVTTKRVDVIEGVAQYFDDEGGYAGPMKDIQNAYNEQQYFQGPGGHMRPSLKELFIKPEFECLKVPNRTHWSHQARYTKYADPGDEIKIIHKLGKIIYEGTKVEAREAVLQPSLDTTYVQEVSYYVSICVLGLLGKSTDEDFPSGFATSGISTQIKMDIKAHRANIFYRQPKQYIVETPMEKVTIDSNPQVIEPVIAAYS
uniref:hypothetical protein n=1 Tax=Flavobacterium sp. TaxID=239 RepID=UPI00404838CB